MAVIDFTEKDLLRGKVVKPNYYLVEIGSASEPMSKDGGSTNYLIDDATILEDETGDKEFTGVPTPRWSFNSKAKGFMIPFFESLNGGEKIEANSRMRFDNSSLQGKKIYVFIGNKEYEGRMVNEIHNKYKPYRG